MAEDVATTAGEASLETTPTWAVATLCFSLILISTLIEHGLHLLAKYFHRKRRRALNQALNKIKSELMLLGFISLLLTMIEKPIATICIPQGAGEIFLPCKKVNGTIDFEEETKCEKLGKVSLLTRQAVRQLQYLIFIMAVFHVFSCVLTFGLGMAKMKKWESWEAETRTLEYQFSNDPRRFRLAHETSFGKRHLTRWSDYQFLLLPACFLRQFYESVSKADYFTLRHGFITAHFAEGSSFDFQKFLSRALEKDFGVVVGISFWIWIFSVLFIFLNAHVFHSYLWLPFIPLVMLLVVGTKLQGIITKMCLDSHVNAPVVRGTYLVRPSDRFFWFGRPQLLLHLMHFILFQNSFQLAFFTWTWYKFGLKSCFHWETEDIVIRMVMGLLVHVLCGYVTLPLYALVTQMGSSMGKAVFAEGVVKGLKRWRATAKIRAALRKKNSNLASFPSVDTSIEASSLSFSLEASFSIDLNRSPNYDGFSTVETTEKDEVNGKRTEEQRENFGSFEGFDIGNLS